MWDLPGPGLEPMTPALAGGFLTTVPPGKSETIFTYRKVVTIVQKNAHKPFTQIKKC